MLLLLLLTACSSGGGDSGGPSTPVATGFALPQRAVPTLPPPKWTEAAEVMTLKNIERIANTGRLDALASGPSTVFAYAFSPDATRLAGLNNEQLIVWDLITGKTVFSTARGQALFVYYSPDKTEIYTIDNNALVSVYDADTGRPQTTFQGSPQYNSVAAYAADDGWLALGGRDGTIKVWDVAQRISIVTINAHKLQIKSLTFSPDGKSLASSGDEGGVKIWDWRARKQLTSVDSAPALRLEFSPDGAQIAVGESQAIKLASVADGKLLHTLATGPGGVADVMLYSPDGALLVNGGGIPALTVWDTQTGQLVNSLPGVGGDATSAAFSPDGDLLATSILGGTVSLWDMTKIRDKSLGRADLAVPTRQILYLAWSADSHVLALFDAAGPVHVWGVAAPPPTPTPSQG